MTLHIKQERPVQFDLSGRLEHPLDPSRLIVRARLRPVEARAVSDAGLLDAGEGVAFGENWFWFTAEVSNDSLDSYYTHMSANTLRNFAREASEGVALLDSHDGYKLGVGFSAGGRYEEEGGGGRALGVFYIVPGIRFGGKHSYASSDDYIAAIKNGVVRDVSVGFYGGKWICDLCHQPYFGRDTACNHMAGFEYEIENDGRLERLICTVLIDDAHLSEVSLVYDGATPGAMILKAEQEAEAGRMSAGDISRFEQQYRVRLPRPTATPNSSRGEVKYFVAPDSAAAYTFTVNAGAQGVRNMEDEEVLVSADDGGDAGAEPQADETPVVEEMQAEIDEIRRALVGSPAPEGVRLHEAVRGMVDQLATTVRERDAAQAEIARLQPLADQGRAYREELINQAVAEGVRALGESFPEETYRAMLVNAPLEHIRQVRDTFTEQAKLRFPGGRQTRDASEDEEVKRPSTPAAAYGAQ